MFKLPGVLEYIVVSCIFQVCLLLVLVPQVRGSLISEVH